MVNGGEVVIVSGPPGAGKTTVAAALASRADRSVHLESDWFFRWIRSGFIPPHLPASQAQNTVVMDLVTDTAAGYARAGYTVMWDGIVGPWFLDRVVRRLSAQAVEARYLVLRPSRQTSLERVRARDGETETAAVEVMWDQFADLGAFESHVVVSDGSPDDVLARCEAALRDGGLRVAADAWVDDRWPVSVKGVLAWNGSVVVLRNERGEWELPGGRLEPADGSPEQALQREFVEELAIDVGVGALIDSWIYDVEGKRVLVLTYACTADRPSKLHHSTEHRDVAVLSVEELQGAAIPAGYVRSVLLALDAAR